MQILHKKCLIHWALWCWPRHNIFSTSWLQRRSNRQISCLKLHWKYLNTSEKPTLMATRTWQSNHSRVASFWILWSIMTNTLRVAHGLSLASADSQRQRMRDTAWVLPQVLSTTPKRYLSNAKMLSLEFQLPMVKTGIKNASKLVTWTKWPQTKLKPCSSRQ